MTEKYITIRQTDINQSLSDNYVAEFDRGHFTAAPMINYNTTDRLTTFNGSIDSAIGFPGTMVADEEFLIMTSWGQGFGVLSIDNTGLFTEEYHELQPNANYQYYQCLAVDKVRKIAYVSNYVHDGITQYDFNGDWSSTPTKTLFTTANSNLLQDELGHSYHNGSFMAGDWIYTFPEDVTIYEVPRWNPYTDVSESYPIANTTRYTRYAISYYSEEHDMGCIYTPNSLMCLILNASTATPTTRFVNVDSQGSFTSYGSMFIPDPTNINILYCAGSARYAKLDITDVIAGTTNTPTWLIDTYDTRTTYHPYIGGSSYVRAGGNGSLNTIGDSFNSSLFLTYGDRGYYPEIGFIDHENLIPLRFNAASYKTGKHLRYDYGHHPVKLQSPNNTDYWVIAGHGDTDGSKLSIFTNPPAFRSNAWNITTNILQLDNQANIVAIQVRLVEKSMTNSTSTIEVSNNDGSTWETYSGNVHIFATTGNDVRVRYSVTNTPNTTNYIYGEFSVILYEQIPYQPIRYLTTRITGKT